MKFMGAEYWSKHKEGRKAYYKQRVGLSPPDYLPKHKLNLTTFTEFTSLAILVMSLSIRLEALINELVKNNILTGKKRDILLQENWKKLLDIARKKEVLKEINLQLCKVLDADEGFD